MTIPTKMSATVVGIGGIGSWVAEFLARAGTNLTLVDGDSVEAKNLSYANFLDSEVGRLKVEALGNRLTARTEVKVIPSFIKKVPVSPKNLTIFCLDSIGARIRLVNSAMVEGRPFLDCRAEGDQFMIFTHKSKLTTKFFTARASPEKRWSCQPDLDNIQAGNLVCASMATQIALDILRGKDFPPEVLSSKLGI